MHACLRHPLPPLHLPAASCDAEPTRSCECLRQCRAFYCRFEGMPCEWIHLPAPDRGCYTREGVPPERQVGRLAGWLAGWLDGWVAG